MLPKETVLSGAEHPGSKLTILESPAGFYLGFLDADGQPYTRETVYMTEQQAQAVLSFFRQ